MGIIQSRYIYEVFDIYIRGSNITMIARMFERSKKPYVILHSMIYPSRRIYISKKMYKDIELLDYKMDNIDVNNETIRELLFPDQFQKKCGASTNNAYIV